MVEHVLLVLAIQERWPDLVHGRDFWVAHPLDRMTGEQCGDAFIAEWKGSVSPNVADLLKRAERLRPLQTANDARRQRDGLLAASDWTQASDVPVDTREKWAAYRQTLREIPQQPDFPMGINWPTRPADKHR